MEAPTMEPPAMGMAIVSMLRLLGSIPRRV